MQSERSYLEQMSVSYDQASLYDFLPTQSAPSEEVVQRWEFEPNSVQYMAELIVSKEATQEDSPWEARMHSYGYGGKIVDISDDPHQAAESYITHLGTATFSGRRTFEFDRPVHNSPTGATNMRLEIDARKGVTQDQFTHTVTLHTPRTAPETPAPAPFDEAEYAHMQELMASGQFEAWEMRQLAAAKEAAKNPDAQRLPTIAYQDIASQFIFRAIRVNKQRRDCIYTSVFQPNDAMGHLTRIAIPIDAYDQIERAYSKKGILPKLTANQAMILGRLGGADSLVRHNLSLALRHLNGV